MFPAFLQGRKDLFSYGTQKWMWEVPLFSSKNFASLRTLILHGECKSGHTIRKLVLAQYFNYGVVKENFNNQEC